MGKGQRVRVVDGVLHADDVAYPNVSDLIVLPVRPRYIALLLGKRTASSAEILALGFRDQANVRSFGEQTAGKTSAYSTVRLSNGGAASITTALLRDRKDAVQRGPLVPDQLTPSPLQAATDWLEAKCSKLEPAQ